MDRYIKTIYPLLTNGKIQEYLRKGKIKLDNKKVQAYTRVYNNNIISIAIDLEAYKISQNNKLYTLDTRIVARKIFTEYLLYEDMDIVVVNKPNNLPTQGGIGIDLSVDHALQYLNSTHGSQYKLLHRLDKETSGVLVIAKNIEVARKVGLYFKERTIQKKYIAILTGIPKISKGEIVSQISKIKDKQNKFMVSREGNNQKIAITKYEIINASKEHNLSLCIFEPHTGRMHQLRHHANLIECYIVGDKKYSLEGPVITDLKYKSNLALHAYEIAIPNLKLRIRAPLPDLMSNTINKIFGFNSVTKISI